MKIGPKVTTHEYYAVMLPEGIPLNDRSAPYLFLENQDAAAFREELSQYITSECRVVKVRVTIENLSHG